MSIYAVYSAPETATPPLGAERHLLRDGFSWGATLFLPIWALVHRLWLELVFWVAGMALLWVLSTFIGGEAVFWLYVLMAVLIGFEASAIRAMALTRAGWRYAGEVVADGPDLAELAWLSKEAQAGQ